VSRATHEKNRFNPRLPNWIWTTYRQQIVKEIQIIHCECPFRSNSMDSEYGIWSPALISLHDGDTNTDDGRDMAIRFSPRITLLIQPSWRMQKPPLSRHYRSSPTSSTDSSCCEPPGCCCCESSFEAFSCFRHSR
jgi:hypothetical protein